MSLLTAPDPCAQSLAHAVKFLEEWLNVELYRMGGGTVLAMRWNHRHSTDIDLSADADVFGERIRKNRSAILDRLQQLAQWEEITRIRMTYYMLGWTCATGAVSFVSGRMTGSEVLSQDVEASTRVPLVSSEAVLLGKILGRVLDEPLFLARDGYDIACAAVLEPETLNRTLQSLSKDSRRMFFKALECEAQEPRPGDFKNKESPILNPRFPELARDPWGFANRLLLGEISPSRFMPK